MLDLVITQTATLREALTLIDKTSHGLAFAIDETGALTGVLTDGDIRRSLLKGSTLQTPVADVMQRHYTALPVDSAPETIAATLSDVITHIPLLDKAGRPVDYASFSRLHRIPVSEPSLNGNELAYVVECIKTNWVSSQGRFVNQFESKFAQFHGLDRALSVSNGTVALHLALVALGLQPGDEVIVPDLTFAASANAVIHAGGKPVLVDVNETTWTMDPDLLEEAITPRTRAIMPVHLFGHPCDMTPILAFAKKHELWVIEDCAEALGAEYQGKKIGTFGDAACFSFYGNKLITTGEGGMILFKSSDLFEKAKRLRDHGMTPEKRYWHAEVGYNYRLTNLQAAIGVAQMEQAESFLEKKISLAKQYRSALDGIPGIRFPQTASWAKNVYWLYSILIGPELGIDRDELMFKLLQSGIETRPLFYPLHEMPPYRAFTGGRKFPNSVQTSRLGMSLPSAVTLTTEEVDRIAQAFKRILGIKQLYQSAQRSS